MDIDTGFIDGHNSERGHVFLQWKGTDACFDFNCDCGAQSHFDGYFAHIVKCPRCGCEWEMPCILYPRKRDERSYEGHNAKTMEWEDDEMWRDPLPEPPAP